MRRTPLPYTPDSSLLFQHVADEPWAMYLDSGPPDARQGRHDIIVARPRATLVERAGHTEACIDGRAIETDSGIDSLNRLRPLIGPTTPSHGLPFAGGAVGYLGYGLGRRLMPGMPAAHWSSDMPDMAMGIYDWAVVIDHAQRTCQLVSARPGSITDSHWDALTRLFSTPGSIGQRSYRTCSPVTRHLAPAGYRRAFEHVQDYIRAGDCYQVNLAQRYTAEVAGDPWAAYLRLRQISPTPFAAYLNLPFGHVLSASPERFLELRAGQVLTKPIKGTRPRGATPEMDAGLARQLQASAKDRAENLMIVDLLRNDLGKVCVPGSITVPKLFEVESYANVHHLVSSVSGRLADGQDALSLLHAAFPGGSITGAPKRRAMEIIEELEGAPRGVYCGSIGYIGYDGDMDSNIAIRTLIWRDGTAEFFAGGGIVADSDADAEYQECLDKAAPMFRLLEESLMS